MKAVTAHTLGFKSGTHAREWASPAAVTFIIRELLNSVDGKRGSIAVHKQLVDAFRWFILPVHNPDGYEFSHIEVKLLLSTYCGDTYCHSGI
jgi:murein tripeptide amidase MpaA